MTKDANKGSNLHTAIKVIFELAKMELSRIGYVTDIQIRPTEPAYVIDPADLRPRLIVDDASVPSPGDAIQRMTAETAQVTFTVAVAARTKEQQGRAMQLLDELGDSRFNPASRYGSQLAREYEYAIKHIEHVLYKYVDTWQQPDLGPPPLPAHPPEIRSNVAQRAMAVASRVADKFETLCMEMDAKVKATQTMAGDIMDRDKRIAELEMSEDEKLIRRIQAKTKEKYAQYEDALLEFAKFGWGKKFGTPHNMVNQFLEKDDGDAEDE